jgi:hypothetical protein
MNYTTFVNKFALHLSWQPKKHLKNGNIYAQKTVSSIYSISAAVYDKQF